jgi:hypothetical protein
MAKTSKPSLAETHPELASQADGWDPTTTTYGSGAKRLWRCREGHQWSAIVSDRKRGTGCPFCSGLRVLPGTNDLATTHPNIAIEAHGWDPTNFKAGSNKSFAWKCPNNHVFHAVVHSRALQGTGCPVCSNQQLLVGYNDLATTHPEIARQADGWDPSLIVAGTPRKFNWICTTGHKWSATVNSRTLLRTGCPICANKQVLAGLNDLATTHPELAAQADGWDPTTVIAGNHKQFDWRCPIGHTWTASLTNRTNRGSGCPICANKQVLAGFNDLATTHPALAAQADGWDPTTVTVNSGKRRKWKCNLGHSWEISIDGRHQGITGCPICSNQRLLIGYNDLATTHPEIAKEADGWDPTLIVAGTHKRFNWRCQIGHLWSSTVDNRTFKRTGCPICANQKVLAGFNDLATTHPELATQADGWDPTTVNAGSNKKMKWICENGHRWSSVLANRSREGVGCPSCAKFGYDPGLPGFLYFIDQFDLEMFQIGITNYPEQRLGKHAKAGWEIVELRGPMDGYLTQQLETSSLHALEKRGAILGHKAGIETFDGYSEAWTKASLKVTSIKQLLDWVYEDESQ